MHCTLRATLQTMSRPRAAMLAIPGRCKTRCHPNMSMSSLLAQISLKMSLGCMVLTQSVIDEIDILQSNDYYSRGQHVKAKQACETERSTYHMTQRSRPYDARTAPRRGLRSPLCDARTDRLRQKPRGRSV